MPLVSTVLIIGAGDLGERFAAGLAAAGAVRRLVLVSRTGAAEAAAMVASAHDVIVEPVACDASQPRDVADLLTRIAPTWSFSPPPAAARGPWPGGTMRRRGRWAPPGSRCGCPISCRCRWP